VITVRTASDEDDLDALNVGNALWYGGARLRRAFAAAPAGEPVEILVGELDGTPVGNASAVGAPLQAFGYGMGAVWVQPAARRQGVGRALYDRVTSVVRSGGVPGVLLGVPDDQPAGLAAAQAWGLAVLGHHVDSELQLADLPAPLVARAVERAAAAGHVLEQPADTEETWQEVHVFLADRMRAAPDNREGGGDLPYGVFRTVLAEPWQVLLARRDGALTGITSVVSRPAAGSLATYLTGVRPDASGQGVSAALKAAHLARLRAAGWQRVLTSNMDQNAAIRAVNARLGFTVTGGASDVGRAFA
jgi:GNAT superfamily N-acetyltransferase